ncbi:conjugal transfer protein TraB [Lysobacter oculi]|uniref:Conjugal transfer protein TraB n=1 Tax=Solilutibacter oculi TaxID=2698682 RepID=A0A344J4T3_9GAMM|nr:TraB/GumN family protein [Lysobacter oculi]AXA84043.1 conjugal transfer protein TraB [Lysobacter oculi]
MGEDSTPAFDWRSQPHAEIERDGIHYTLLGTAHVSKASVDAVKSAIDSGEFDAVAVELDAQRHAAMKNPDQLAKLDLVKVIREGKVPMFAASLGLAAYQRRLAEQLGIEPGAELKAAASEAQARGLPMHLIDRDVGLTFKRAGEKLGWWRRTMLGSGILASLFFDEKVEDDAIEKLKEGDMLEASFSEFAADNPALYETVIAERDAYMAAKLRATAGDAKRVLAVIGAGHMAGTAQHLREDTEVPAEALARLEALKPKSGIPWFTLLLATFVLGGFAYGFWKGGVDVGTDLIVYWVLITGGLGALGCAIAGGHPLSILGAFVSSPVTPLHPALASGTVSALIEAWVRKPTYGDFMALRDDVQSMRGWWRNRVARVLLNFFLTSTGTAIGVWLGGAKMLGKLIG